jgi:hypothetical protein
MEEEQHHSTVGPTIEPEKQASSSTASQNSKNTESTQSFIINFKSPSTPLTINIDLGFI